MTRRFHKILLALLWAPLAAPAQTPTERDQSAAVAAVRAAAALLPNSSAIGVSFDRAPTFARFGAQVQSSVVTRGLGARGFVYREADLTGDRCESPACQQALRSPRLVLVDWEETRAMRREVRFIAISEHWQSSTGYPLIKVRMICDGDVCRVTETLLDRP